MDEIYLQYGCGFTAPAGWLNFDASPTLRFERIPLIGKMYTRNAQRFPEGARYGDITLGLPVEADSCAGIYCSHVLEHLAKDACETALKNTYRYLRPGGIFRLVVPDLETIARDYLKDTREDAGHTFMESSGLGAKTRTRGLRGVLAALGNSAHLWLWDEKSMRHALGAAGFREIRRCRFGDSANPRFKEVEDPKRFEGCLAFECRK
jgi:SAM-dependent methyltransferase